MMYRHNIANLHGEFITDGGMNTTLMFRHGIEIPLFATFVLMDTSEGRQQLRAYYLEYIELAQKYGKGLILETPTWRANRDWGLRLRYDLAQLDRVNRESVQMLIGLRDEFGDERSRIIINGTIGPQGDGYKLSDLSVEEAQEYHSHQIASLSKTDVDMVTGYTLTTVAEATGIALAAANHGVPSVISFTVETNGRLLDGTSLGEAINQIDAATGRSPAYYMINCSHPSHIMPGLDPSAEWSSRLRGVRANASSQSHDSLDGAEQLDAGDALDLAEQYKTMTRSLPAINIYGGCCGTDCSHVAAICEACR
ncbi:homocysteine S-methyltransferase family protein [Rhizobium sp. 2MFCol3.1]|uniref:homocysteine S-methyltransferase family protein n=1 Tax=Rhizobium sp. 2MFCol3.1 TaxID=1246459 RepID=UPI00036042DA|nr:homocysteine S-methyltransferase family protein [Rhizobium sp. 2MFCol3.1]